MFSNFGKFEPSSCSLVPLELRYIDMKTSSFFLFTAFTRGLEMVNIAINLETPDFLLHWHCKKFDKNNLKTRVLLMIESFANNYELVNWYSNYMSLENYAEILYDSKMKYFLILYQIFHAWKKLLLQQSNYNHIKMGCIQLISFFL